MSNISMNSTSKVIEDRIRELETQLSASPAYREMVILRETRDKLLALNTTSLSVGSTQRPQRRGPTKRTTILKGVRKALKAKGHPLTTKRLVQILPQYGTSVGGARPTQNLTSILSKRGDFESIRWQGGPAWWFKGRSLPSDDVLGGDETPHEKAAGHPEDDKLAARSTSNKGDRHAPA